jgi:thiol-disulfide isomerase/thioredoxin
LNSSIFTQERFVNSDYNPKAYNSITDIPIYTLENERFTLYEEMAKLEDDKFLLLNFTSSFCVPCKSEIPELIKLKESNNNLVLWFIFVGDDNTNIQKKISELNMTGDFKILKDPLKTSLKRLGVSAVPMTYLIMKDKKIVTYSLGYTQEKFKKFKNQISEVVK